MAGLVGTALPGLPGPLLIFAAALGHKLLLPGTLSWWSVAAAGLLPVLDLGVSLAGTAVGARWGGVGRAGLVGAVIGFLIGLTLGPVGALLGSLAGAALAEWKAAGRSPRDALRAALGLFLGFGGSLVARVALALAVCALLVADCFLL